MYCNSNAAAHILRNESLKNTLPRYLSNSPRLFRAIAQSSPTTHPQSKTEMKTVKFMVGDKQVLLWDVPPGGEAHTKTFQAQRFMTTFVRYCGFHVWQLALHSLNIAPFNGQKPTSIKPLTMKRFIPLNQSRAARTTTAEPQTIQNFKPLPHFLPAIVLPAGAFPPGPKVPTLYSKRYHTSK
jgi:hypothetical protein